jgi:hypothetical protein
MHIYIDWIPGGAEAIQGGKKVLDGLAGPPIPKVYFVSIYNT